MRTGWLFLALCFVCPLPVFSQQETQKFLGSWEASLESPGGALRFGLSVLPAESKPIQLKGFFHNGDERIEIPEVRVESGRLVLDVTHYDSILTLSWNPKDKSLAGDWKKRRGPKEWVEMKVTAVPSSRVPRTKKREFFDYPGTWSVKFSKSADPAVAIFEADGRTGHIKGTFLTTTGDYRFLDGVFVDGALELSCFDGAHAFLFRCHAKGKNQLVGKFWSSNTWEEEWTATRDPEAKLPNAFLETIVDRKADLSKYRFPDLDGKPRSLTESEFQAKARIIYVFGSWCPNCHDAAAYFAELQDWYGKDLHILGLAFELTGDRERDAKQVRNYLKRHKCTYPVLLAGLADKKKASQALPFLDRVRSYPTTLFLDGTGKIIAVHTGFSGPATGAAYSAQKKKFEEILDRIIGATRKSP